MKPISIQGNDTQKYLQGLIRYGLTLPELSEMLNEPYNSIAGWLHGWYIPKKEEKKEKVKKLAEEFSIDIININPKNRITKVVFKEKVNGKILAMSRLHRYADAFVIGYGVDKKNTIFDPEIHDAKIVTGIGKAVKEWNDLKEAV